jgi:MFS family permease
MDAAQTQKSSIRLLFAASTGTIIEWYDFAVFAFCAALVFNTAFFPVVDPITGLIAALSTQAVGFIARPAGGWFFGVLGDRIGRKRALVISLFLMGGATVAMGLLPTYQQIGVFAPLLLLLMRLLQGFAIGGESTGALVLIAESLPAKQRGLWTGFPMIGGPAGNVIATAVIGAVIGHFGSDAFVEWAWRIPFIASILLIGLGLWVRRKVEESPAFIHLQEQKTEAVKAPLREAITTQGANMLRVLFVKAGESALFYLFSTFFVVLATVFLKVPREAALGALFIGSIAEVAVILAAGATADRYAGGSCGWYRCRVLAFQPASRRRHRDAHLGNRADALLSRYYRGWHVGLFHRTLPGARSLHGHVDILFRRHGVGWSACPHHRHVAARDIRYTLRGRDLRYVDGNPGDLCDDHHAGNQRPRSGELKHFGFFKKPHQL